MNLNELSLTEIWNLSSNQAIKILDDLNIQIHSGATLTELRSLIAIHKKQILEAKPVYENQDATSVQSNEYEDIDDFSGSSRQSTPSPNLERPEEGTNTNMATEKVPFFHPGTFSGTNTESVEGFLTRMNRAAIVNGWTEEKKKMYIPMYLTDTALTVFENLERKNPRMTWQQIKEELTKTFSPIESDELLLAKLNTRVQLPTESVAQYMADVVRLCSLTDNGMQETKICNHILKGLNPGILQLVALMDNSSLEKLKENISKYEMSSFMMKQRLGLENTTLNCKTVQQDEGINERMVSVENAMRQLQISLVRDEYNLRRPQSDQDYKPRRWDDERGTSNYRIDRDHLNRRKTGLQYTQRRWDDERGTYRDYRTYRDDFNPRRPQQDFKRDGQPNERTSNYGSRRQDFKYGRAWQNYDGEGEQRGNRWRNAYERNRERSPEGRGRPRDWTQDKGKMKNREDDSERCFKCGSLEHYARGCKSKFQKN